MKKILFVLSLFFASLLMTPIGVEAKNFNESVGIEQELNNKIVIRNMGDTTNFQQSMEILEELGCNVKKEPQLSSMRSAKNDNRVNLGNESFALLDEDDRIISIDRIKETNENSFRQSTPKKDFRFTQAIVEEKLIKEGYELVHSGYFDDTTLRLRYEKMMPYGGHNQYDAYDVYIDTENGSLVSFKKKGIEKEEISFRSFNQARSHISEDKAISIANEFLKKYNKEEIQEVRIGTAIPNNDFFRLMDEKEETEPVIISEENLEDHIIKEVYILKNEEVEVHVDLYTGEIVGGELYLYNAGAASVMIVPFLTQESP